MAEESDSKPIAAMSLNERSKRFVKGFSSTNPPTARHNPTQTKIKLEGRRRLFKISPKGDDDDDENLECNRPAVDEPDFSGIMDFDSPPAKTQEEPRVSDRDFASLEKIRDDEENDRVSDRVSDDEERVSDGDFDSSDEIRDALDDFSSNLEVNEGKVETFTDSSSVINEEELGGDRLDEGRDGESKQEYGSAGSAFSLSPEPSDLGAQVTNSEHKEEQGKTQEAKLEEKGGLVSLRGDNQLVIDEKPKYQEPAFSFAAEEKPQIEKTKLEGKRRLCKVSLKDDKADDKESFVEPNFSAIMDFDSPPCKIRDILDDLSSKLDCLSIDRKKVGTSEPPSGFSRVTKVEASNKLKEDEISVSSVSLSNFAAKSKAQKEKYEEDRFVDCVNDVKVDKAHKSHVPKKIEETASKESCLVLSDDERDPYLILSSAESSRRSCMKTVKVEKETASKESCLVLSDDERDPYLILSGVESSRRSCTKTAKVEKNVKSSTSIDAPKDSSGGNWIFENGESIVLSGKPSNYILPGNIAKILYPHQQSGLRWLWSLHCKGTGGILGDDMGLGKTMQICSFLAGLFHSSLIKRVLVVAPKTLLTHWIKELRVVGLSDKIREYFGTCAKLRQYELQYIFQDKGILLTTYDIVRNNYISLRGDSYLDHSGEDSVTWDYIILDEGHIIKNPSTQRAKSLLAIPCNHRIIISGTPIQNNLKELWALFSFCCPELLGDKNEFKVKYEYAILRGNDKNATDREKRIGSTVAKELRNRIEPYFLRRLKSDVFRDDDSTNTAKLSKKNEIIVWLRLTQSQRQLYEAFLNSELVLSSFAGSPLAAITVLKKICDHPYLLTKRAAEDVLEGMETMVNQDDLGVLEKMAHHLANSTHLEDFQDLIDNVSCKITFILSLLDHLIPEGHRVLIFSQTRKMLNFVQEAIISKGYRFLRIDGTTKIIDREKIVNRFQEGEGGPVFLLTSQVGGLGLTLTNADRVIVVDPAWNPSTDNQSVDRAYRIGQKKDVLVYRLMTAGTIEEKIYRMQVFKGGLFRTATEQKEQTRYFSQQDLRELFSLPKEGFDVSVTQQQMDEEHDQHHIMEESLKKHIEFLKSQGIAGVSNHSLLFSKTAPTPTPVLEEHDEVPRPKPPTSVRYHSTSSSVERSVDGAEHAMNPKDFNKSKIYSTSPDPNKLTKSDIKDRIERLHQTYKTMKSKLPDRGEKLKRQIADLSSELQKINMAESSQCEIIDLDDLSGKLHRVHV